MMVSTKVGGRPQAARSPLWRRPKAATIVGYGQAVIVAVAVAAAYTPYTHYTQNVGSETQTALKQQKFTTNKNIA